MAYLGNLNGPRKSEILEKIGPKNPPKIFLEDNGYQLKREILTFTFEEASFWAN